MEGLELTQAEYDVLVLLSHGQIPAPEQEATLNQLEARGLAFNYRIRPRGRIAMAQYVPEA